MATPTLKQLRKKAIDLIRMGEKVYHYRKDLLTPEDLQTLQANTIALETCYKNKAAGAGELEQSLNAQHEVLVKTGGTFYPNRFWSENVETIMVVAIVIIAFRIFFFQPFVIPTSSMYPTYSGMKSHTYEVGASAASPLDRIALKLLRGGTHYQITAQNTGEIAIPVNPQTGRMDYRLVPGRKWFVLQTIKKEYTLFVGDNPYTLLVPAEYYLDDAIIETFIKPIEGTPRYDRIRGKLVQKTGVTVEKGEVAFQFDILMGDALFVNRFWYHFVQPKSGDPIVFRTESFMNRSDALHPEALGEDKFYIKRLVGEPGQTLEIKNYALFQNGEPAQGAAAFAANAAQEGEYPGYRNRKLLSEGQTYTVPEDEYFAMGDNSSNSRDSRYFGPVPKKSIIGSANFIYYPFTKRWGVAK
jgi:signal peptidase I